jgi:hypothetical protein
MKAQHHVEWNRVASQDPEGAARLAESALSFARISRRCAVDSTGYMH